MHAECAIRKKCHSDVVQSGCKGDELVYLDQFLVLKLMGLEGPAFLANWAFAHGGSGRSFVPFAPF